MGRRRSRASATRFDDPGRGRSRSDRPRSGNRPRGRWQHRFPTIRVGMHTGPATEREDDWFGSTVNLAARVAAEAAGGEVLVSDATRSALPRPERFRFRERGRVHLRNISEPVLLFSALRRGLLATGDLPIDPVCRMAVDPDGGAGALEHRGTASSSAHLPAPRGSPRIPSATRVRPASAAPDRTPDAVVVAGPLVWGRPLSLQPLGTPPAGDEAPYHSVRQAFISRISFAWVRTIPSAMLRNCPSMPRFSSTRAIRIAP